MGRAGQRLGVLGLMPAGLELLGEKNLPFFRQRDQDCPSRLPWWATEEQGIPSRGCGRSPTSKTLPSCRHSCEARQEQRRPKIGVRERRVLGKGSRSEEKAQARSGLGVRLGYSGEPWARQHRVQRSGKDASASAMWDWQPSSRGD